MFFFFNENENKMGVPGFEQTMKPILIALEECGGRASIGKLDEATIRVMNLSEEVTKVMHKGSNKQSEIEYRMAWGRTYLKKYGLINNVQRGVWAFTEKFDGNIEQINVDEIVQKVRSNNIGREKETVALTGFESSIAFGNMVRALLREIAEKEGKQIYNTYLDSVDSEYDMVFPKGFEEHQEEVKCVIKYINESRTNSIDFYHMITEKYNNYLKNEKLLIITNIVVAEKELCNSISNVIIWDKEDLVERIQPEAWYAQYLINPRQALIEEVVATDNSVQKKRIERERYLKQLKNAFHNQDLVLFLGAGVSISGGIPLWETLIKTLHVYMLDRLTKDKELSFEQQKMIKELATDNEMESPLMQMRYIKAAFSNEEYYKLVHSALYSKKIDLDTELLNAIAKISTPQRAYCGVKSIITYNFDDLLERKFTERDIQYNVIADEGERQLVDKLNIYHVHGYLPNNISENFDAPNLIFSEEDYHKVYRDSYSWSNLTQLSALRENTCLFIGCSLTDPNLRRLLDVSTRSDESPRHYAFLKRKETGGETTNKEILKIYQKIDDNIKTAYYNSLGLNIIWVEDYEEIPKILNDFLD